MLRVDSVVVVVSSLAPDLLSAGLMPQGTSSLPCQSGYTHPR